MGFSRNLSSDRSSSRGTGLRRRLLIATLLLGLVPLETRSQGSGDLAIAPTRVVIEGRGRSARVSLQNKGAATATYRISIVNMRMSETGKFERIEEPGPGDKFAQELIRYSPRQVTLPPGGTQTVRILIRKPKDLEIGEYRSHLLVQSVPKPEAMRDIEEALSESGVRIGLVVIPSITIPIIVRAGELAASSTLSEVRLAKPTGATQLPRLSFRINRSGNRSLFGDLTVTYENDVGGRYVLAQANKLAVYTPNPSRRVELFLRVPEGVPLKGGRLHVMYRGRPEDGNTLLADARINVP